MNLSPRLSLPPFRRTPLSRPHAKRQLRLLSPSEPPSLPLAPDELRETMAYRAGRTLEPLLYVPIALPVGVLLGELAHRKVDERRFKLGLFALLFLAGLSLFIR